MKRKIFRNILWIALIAVWSFLAGAYFNLGWNRKPSVSYLMGFITGGIAMWMVFSAMGILLYRYTKKQGMKDPAKLPLGVITFFTLCFLIIAGVKYDKVKKGKFVEDMEESFIIHYQDKALAKGIKIEDLYWELKGRYSAIHHELLRDPQLEKLMELKTMNAVFEENTVIAALCISSIKSEERLGYPAPKGMLELFEKP